MKRAMFNIVKKFCKAHFSREVYLFIGKLYYLPSKLFVRIKERRQREKVIAYLRNEYDPEKAEIITFLEKNKIQPFPYFFTQDHLSDSIIVYQSSDSEEKYILYRGKKMFFPRTWDEKRIKEYTNSLLIEQDKRSPHNYEAFGDCVPLPGEIIADIGAAEGIWALSYVEFAKKVYLFECDSEWVEALELTFTPWKDKVEVIQKYVCSGGDSKERISLDSFFADKHVDCIKADIEGAEEEMLLGGSDVFRNKISKAILCVYHKYDDEVKFKKLLRDYGFSGLHVTSGFMLFSSMLLQRIYSEDVSTYIRRGVLCARK